jgi:hypothetical protein
MTNEEYIAHLRSELGALRARYDGGAVPAAVYAAIKELEVSIAWHEHKGRTPTVVRVAKMEKASLA